MAKSSLKLSLMDGSQHTLRFFAAVLVPQFFQDQLTERMQTRAKLISKYVHQIPKLATADKDFDDDVNTIVWPSANNLVVDIVPAPNDAVRARLNIFRPSHIQPNAENNYTQAYTFTRTHSHIHSLIDSLIHFSIRRTSPSSFSLRAPTPPRSPGAKTTHAT